MLIAINRSCFAVCWVNHSIAAVTITIDYQSLWFHIVLNEFDTLFRKAQYFAGDVKAQTAY